MKKEQGFSLIELLIVVAIIAIIAAIAVPSMLQARMAANESGAIQGCRTIGSTLVARGNLDGRFDPASGGFNGYAYIESADANLGDTGNPDGFGFQAEPQGTKGRYIYGIGPDQVVRYLGLGTDAPADTQPPMCGTDECPAGSPIGMNSAASGS
jgi:prepilin-type N-terminal cleavage/methylation domain-containing protein